MAPFFCAVSPRITARCCRGAAKRLCTDAEALSGLKVDRAYMRSASAALKTDLASLQRHFAVLFHVFAMMRGVLHREKWLPHLCARYCKKQTGFAMITKPVFFRLLDVVVYIYITFNKVNDTFCDALPIMVYSHTIILIRGIAHWNPHHNGSFVIPIPLHFNLVC